MEDKKDEALTKLIADSLELIEAEQRERDSLESAQKIEFDSLLFDVAQQVLSKVKDFPSALLPYSFSAHGPGGYDCEANIKELKQGWKPDYFIVQAPGLVRISFRITHRNGENIVSGISFTGSHGTFTSWPTAIGRSAQYHRELYDMEQSNAYFNSVAYRASLTTTSTAERLADLIREIAQEQREESV